eukprot:m.112769 g.112769  ORF g.112769 m.112769 type:complete len:195 (+) comp28218_c1_seq2:132-716(+)
MTSFLNHPNGLSTWTRWAAVAVIAVLSISTPTMANTLVRRSNLCGADEPIRRTGLTPSIAEEVCPDYLTNEYVRIKHAFVTYPDGKRTGGHCGGSDGKTEQLQLSIANKMFGGNTQPKQSSVSMTFPHPYDCTAWCVQNSEDKGHFKFNPKKIALTTEAQGCVEELKNKRLLRSVWISSVTHRCRQPQRQLWYQ